MKKIWTSIKEFMNIEPDTDVARAENTKAIRLILLVSLINSFLLILMDRLFYGRTRFEEVTECGFILFLLAFSFVNWSELKNAITVEMEVSIVVLLIFIAFIDYYPKVEISAFRFLIMLVVLPAMIYDRPWKILALIIISAVFAMVFNFHIEDAAVRTQNYIRIISVSFIASVFGVYYSHAKIRGSHMRKSTLIVAEHDPLTGIYNRAGGIHLITECVENHESGTFMIIDIDDFKHVNDNYGHQKGDDVLKAVAGILKSNFKSTDIVMRMGGDEFIIYALGMVDYEATCRRLDELNHLIHTIRLGEDGSSYVSVSIGAAINDGSYPTYEALYKAADHYLYRTKAKGKDGYSVLGKEYSADIAGAS